MSKILFLFLVLVIGFYLGTWFYKSKIIEKVVTKEIKKEIYPECVADICPRFYQIDAIPTNNSPETAIIIPLAMTQGFGKLIIVEKGGEKFLTAVAYLELV